MMNANDAIPPEILEKLTEFRAALRTGKIELDLKDGRVISFRATEAGRVRPARVNPLEPRA